MWKGKIKYLARITCIVILAIGIRPASAGRHNFVTDLPTDELGGSFQFDYDGSRGSDALFRASTEIELGDWDRWFRFSLDTYTGTSGSWDASEDVFASVEIGHSLLRDHDHRLYLNGALQLDLPSLLSSSGMDLNPQLGLAWGIAPDVWLGAELGTTFSTSRDPGMSSDGYPFANIWLVWFPGGNPDEESDESDAATSPLQGNSLTLNFWLPSTDRTEVDSSSTTVGIEYRFGLTESIEAQIGSSVALAGDEKGMVSGSFGLRWNF